jgi:hypothetical protein
VHSLRWRTEDLARQSTLGVTTIRRAELTEAQTSMPTANDLAVRRALEAAGVEFIDERGDLACACVRHINTENANSGFKESFAAQVR